MIGEHLLLFGCMVGVGELVGSILLGRLITIFGYVLVTILAGCLAIISLLLTYMTIPGVRQRWRGRKRARERARKRGRERERERENQKTRNVMMDLSGAADPI